MIPHVVAHFSNDQKVVYFGNLNDVEPNKRNYHSWSVIGKILAIFHLAYPVHIIHEGPKTIYMYPKFKTWVEKHKADAGIDREALDRAFSKRKTEEAIKIICDNFDRINRPLRDPVNAGDQNRENPVNNPQGNRPPVIEQEGEDPINIPEDNIPPHEDRYWNVRFSYEQIIAKAEEQFNDHRFKRAILNDIRTQLINYRRSGRISLDWRGRISQYQGQQQRDQALIYQSTEAFFLHRYDLFSGIDVTVSSWCPQYSHIYGYKITKAEEQFSYHPYKEEILNAIRHHLRNNENVGRIDLDNRVRQYQNEEERQRDQAIKQCLRAFFNRGDLFPGAPLYVLEGPAAGEQNGENPVNAPQANIALVEGPNQWGIPFSYEQVTAIAEEQFSYDPYKREILDQVRLALNSYRRCGHIDIDQRGRIYQNEEERRQDQAIKQGMKIFFNRRDLFSEDKIRIDRWNIPLSYEQIIAIAEEQFINNPHRDEILNKIRLFLHRYKSFGRISYDAWPNTAINDAVEDFFHRRDLFLGVIVVGAM